MCYSPYINIEYALIFIKCVAGYPRVSSEILWFLLYLRRTYLSSVKLPLTAKHALEVDALCLFVLRKILFLSNLLTFLLYGLSTKPKEMLLRL